MKAVAINDFDHPPALADDFDKPQADDGQILVRVEASSVNPVDGAIAAGMLNGMVEHEFPVVLGRDYAGVVEEVGAGVTAFAAGDDVFGFLLHANPTVHDGAWAEYIVISDEAASIARRPGGIDAISAAAAPLAGISAMTAVDALELGDGDTVLIVGATGGVGSFATQLAAAAGATVIAPALPEDEGYLRGLGATEVLPRDGDVAAVVRERYADGVNALLDVVSYTPEELGAYAAALKGGGRAASPNSAAGDGPGRTNVMAAPSPDNLDRLSRFLGEGTIKVPIQKTYALSEAPGALQSLGSAHTQGKLAIRIA